MPFNMVQVYIEAFEFASKNIEIIYLVSLLFIPTCPIHLRRLACRALGAVAPHAAVCRYRGRTLSVCPAPRLGDRQ